MIQYKYYHHPDKGYIDALSLDESKDFVRSEQIKAVFQTLKELKCEKNSLNFTYVYYESQCYFLQYCDAGQSFYHGLVGDLKDLEGVLPIAYAGKLHINYYEGELEGLADTALPPAKTLAPEVFKTVNPSLLAYMLQELLYGSKPLLVCGGTYRQIYSAICCLFLSVPEAYAKRIGFTLNLSPITVPRYGTPLQMIRVFGTTDNPLGYEPYFTICDVSRLYYPVEKPGNYTEIFLLDSMQNKIRTASPELFDFIRSIEACFPDGKRNDLLLSQNMPIFIFKFEKTPSAAERLLTVKQNYPSMQVENEVLYEAIHILLTERALLSENLDSVYSLICSEPFLSDRLLEEFNRYRLCLLISSVCSLTEKERNILISLLADIPQEQVCASNPILSGLLTLPDNITVFDILLSVYRRERGKKWFFLTVGYGGNMQKSADYEVFLKTYFKRADTEAAAILLLPHVPDMEKERTAALLRSAEEIYREPLRLLKLLVVLKAETEKLMHGTMDNSKDYIFLPEKYLKELVHRLTLDELLGLYRNPEVEQYPALKTIILCRLCDEAFVKSGITMDNVIPYKNEIYPVLKNKELTRYIEDYEIRRQNKVLITDFRVDFVKETLHKAPEWEKRLLLQKKLREYPSMESVLELLNQSSHEGKDLAAKKKIVLMTDKYFNKDNDPHLSAKEMSVLYTNLTAVIGLGFSALCFVVLLLPALTKCMVLGSPIQKEISYLFGNLFYFFPILTWFAFSAIYFIRNYISKHNRKKALFDAGRDVLLFDILPLLFFSLGYILIYFIR